MEKDTRKYIIELHKTVLGIGPEEAYVKIWRDIISVCIKHSSFQLDNYIKENTPELADEWVSLRKVFI